MGKSIAVCIVLNCPFKNLAWLISKPDFAEDSTFLVNWLQSLASTKPIAEMNCIGKIEILHWMVETIRRLVFSPGLLRLHHYVDRNLIDWLIVIFDIGVIGILDKQARWNLCITYPKFIVDFNWRLSRSRYCRMKVPLAIFTIVNPLRVSIQLKPGVVLPIREGISMFHFFNRLLHEA